MEKYKNDISKNNINDKIKTIIAELNERREQEIKIVSNDLHYQHRYRGTVLSLNSSIWDDIDKSIEYETLLLSILEIINKKQLNITSIRSV
jgi:hypothetical protein